MAVGVCEISVVFIFVNRLIALSEGLSSPQTGEALARAHKNVDHCAGHLYRSHQSKEVIRCKFV